MTFHGKNTHANIKEPGLTVKFPLIVLAILSICIGGILFEPILVNNLLNKSVIVMPEHNAVESITEHFNGHISFMYHAFGSLVFWLTFLGIVIAYLFYYLYPELPNIAARRFRIIYYVLANKYGFDSLYEIIFVRGSKFLGEVFTKIIDNLIIDTILVDGIGVITTKIGRIISRLQTGLVSHYLSFMIFGGVIIFIWVIMR